MKMVDDDQKDKALAIQVRNLNNMPHNFYLINEYAAKAYREAFIDYIIKLYPEFFDENQDDEEILDAVNSQAQSDIDKFIKNTCGEYEMPCLTFTVSAPDL